MPTFNLKDGFGFNANITPNTGALVKYFQSLPDITVSDINLSNPPATSAQGGLTFSHAVNLGKNLPELTINAGLCGTVNVFVPSSEGAPLFDPDDFGDNIAVPLSQRYVSAHFTANLQGSASASQGDLKFGFDAQKSVELAFYRQLDQATPLGNALVNTIQNFFIPADLDDIANMPENSIATVSSTGQLCFSGSVNLLSFSNPLATLPLPSVVGSGPQLTAGASVTVGASYKFTGEYQVRVHRFTGSKFHLGFYRKRNSEFKFDVDAKASIGASFRDKDLFTNVMNQISSDPGDKDCQDLQASGLPDDQVAGIKQAIACACNRTLEIGVGLELSREDESKAIFLYEVDLSALDDDGRQKLHLALEGDITGLVDIDPDSPPAGITVLKTLISRKKTLQHSFKLNLLGIYDVQNISTLIVKGTTAWDAASGAMIMTDTVIADKLGLEISTLKADPVKVRKVLSDHFLITASYRAVHKVLTSGPQFQATQSYFKLDNDINHVYMRDNLILSSVLGLQSEAVALAQLSDDISDFGRTTVYAEAGYDDQAFQSLFFDQNGALFPAQLYTNVGRMAIESIVRPGDPDDYRLKLVNDTALFNDLAQIGAVGSTLFRQRCQAAQIPLAGVPIVGADLLDVLWFAGAMVTAGQRLQAIASFISANPGLDPNNHDFKNLRQSLANAMANVVDKSTVDFGGPWGFCAMTSLGKASSEKWSLVNKFITQELSQGQPQLPNPPAAPLAAGAAAGNP